MFSYRVRESIPDLLLHQKLGIAKNGAQYRYGKSDLFAVVISMRYLLPRKDFLVFKGEIVKLLNQFEEKSDAIEQKELLKAMGFPENWKDITRYRKI